MWLWSYCLRYLEKGDKMKTPEEMAEEYCGTTGWLEDDYVWRETEAGFLAGYKAAQQWISVKDRLPEEGQRVLLYNSLEYVSIVMAHWYSSSQRPFFDHVTIDDIHMTFALEDNKHLYWMPLPAPPKEDK